MLVVREAYLTTKQMEHIGAKLNKAMPGPDKRKQRAEEAARAICGSSYFPLYAKDKGGDAPIAWYFTGQRVIIPTGLNELRQKIYEEWSLPEPEKGIYRAASKEQAGRLRSYLSQFIKSDGQVTEPAFRFLSSFEYLLFREGAQWKQYRLLFPWTGNFKGYFLPVWSYSFQDRKELLDGWVELYRDYGLVPAAGELSDWLHNQSAESTITLTGEQYSKLKEWFRGADHQRLGNKYYDLSERIFDNGQCWDVFEKAQPDIKKTRCLFPGGEWLGTQAPYESGSVKSAMDSGLVVIDFGTKNSVVVLGDQATKNFSVLKPKKGYAGGSPLHATILKFGNLEAFLEAYRSEAGRPDTRWETVSIDNSSRANGNVDSALGIFRELKQWMMDPNAGGAVLRQKDAPDKPILLGTYGAEENSVDPIELYAYYLGLYANNNQDNKIFMRYRLSFSATCPEQVQVKMRESFRRGLAKSLPASIINSNEMKNFSVDCTCSEPAAYAVCALACMGMPYRYRDRFFYGIFDFGGGTCDFNYGIWGLEQDQTLHRDNYKIWMLGDGGDPFLGGENLLELLAVQVCRQEQEWFREMGYKISRPRCYEGGDEEFFSASFEAASNLEYLVEQLRGPVWEKPDESKEEFEIYISGLLPERKDGRNMDAKENKKSGSERSSSENKDPGSTKKLSKASLLRLLAKRIYEGVSAFFHTFYRTLDELGQKEVPQICVFLAGGSCRSRLVRITFEKYINEEMDHSRVERVNLCDPIGSPEFEEHLPAELWDEDQKEKMDANIAKLKDLDGKTGVAYGLALYGKQVKIEDRRVKNRLLYYLGTRSFFDIHVLGGAQGERLVIGESVPFAVSDACDLYYTEIIPRDGELRGVRTLVLNGRNLPMEEDMTWFVRANSQTEISIFAVSGGDPEEHDPKEELIFDLQSGQLKNK